MASLINQNMLWYPPYGSICNPPPDGTLPLASPVMPVQEGAPVDTILPAPILYLPNGQTWLYSFSFLSGLQQGTDFCVLMTVTNTTPTVNAPHTDVAGSGDVIQANFYVPGPNVPIITMNPPCCNSAPQPPPPYETSILTICAFNEDTLNFILPYPAFVQSLTITGDPSLAAASGNSNLPTQCNPSLGASPSLADACMSCINNYGRFSIPNVSFPPGDYGPFTITASPSISIPAGSSSQTLNFDKWIPLAPYSTTSPTPVVSFSPPVPLPATGNTIIIPASLSGVFVACYKS